MAWRDKIGNAGVARIAALKDLNSINLDRTSVTDRGVASLAALRKLASLGLDGDRVTDACLGDMERLAALRVSSVDETDITLAGCQRLYDTLHESIQIHWWLRGSHDGPSGVQR